MKDIIFFVFVLSSFKLNLERKLKLEYGVACTNSIWKSMEILLANPNLKSKRDYEHVPALH